jgi:hypothetical protein
MPFIVTPERRRLAMVAMLGLAIAGGVIRHQAPNPSTLRDVGTLLLVLWLPAVGNLIAYLVRKIPAGRPPPLDFPAGTPFTPHLVARIEPVPTPEGWRGTLDAAARNCTVLIGRTGFTVRAAAPLSQWLTDEAHTVALECLVPATALSRLVPGAAFHLLVGAVAVGRGTVLDNPAVPVA